MAEGEAGASTVGREEEEGTERLEQVEPLDHIEEERATWSKLHPYDQLRDEQFHGRASPSWKKRKAE